MNESSLLVKRLLEARQFWVDAGRFRFHVRRPTEMQLMRMRRGNQIEIGLEIVRDQVIGWEGVTEADLVPAGGGEAVAFDALLYRTWIEDRPDLWQAIADRMFEVIEQHAKDLEAEVKN